MAVCVALSAAGAGAAIAAIRHLNTAGAVYLALVAGADRSDAAGLVAEIHSDLVLHAVISIAGIVSLAPLALAVRRPWSKARSAAWICGVVLSAGLAFALATSPENLASPNGFETAAVRRAMNGLVAGWYPGLTSVLVGAQLVATFAFSVFLLRASSAEFYFRPHQDGPASLHTFLRSPDPDPYGRSRPGIHGRSSTDVEPGTK